MSDELKEFLKAWLEWAESQDSTSKDHPIFSQRAGLCSNFNFWLEVHDQTLLDSSERFLNLLFKEEGLDDQHPFGGPELYIDECIMLEVHKNPKRRAWARKHSC